MPWLAVPFGDPAIGKLSKQFNVRGIPTLIVFDGTGNLITLDGRSLIRRDDHGSWIPEPPVVQTTPQPPGPTKQCPAPPVVESHENEQTAGAESLSANHKTSGAASLSSVLSSPPASVHQPTEAPAKPAVSTLPMQVRSQRESGCDNDTDASVTHDEPNANVSNEARRCLELEALEIEVECGVITSQEYELKKAALLRHATPPSSHSNDSPDDMPQPKEAIQSSQTQGATEGQSLQGDFEGLMAHAQLAEILDELGVLEASALAMLDKEDLDALAQRVDTMVRENQIEMVAAEVVRKCLAHISEVVTLTLYGT